MPSLDKTSVQTDSHVEDLSPEESSTSKDLLNGLDHGDLSRETDMKDADLTDDSPTSNDDDEWLDILGSGELKKKVLKPGKGVDTRPPRGSWITVNLEGKLEDGAVVEKEESFRFILGDCEVVQGLDVAIALMEEGEVAVIVVPARLAYGAPGRTPDIPPDSVLSYEIEILQVESSEEEKDLPISQRISIGDSKRERGNFWYSREEYSYAIHCYRRSLEFLEENDQSPDNETPENQNLLEMRLKVHNNLAAAQLKIEAYDAALKSVENVLLVQPENVKALFRKGKILASKSQAEEAISIFRKAKELDPDNKTIQQELTKLVGKQKVYEQEEKAMYRKMFPKFAENSKGATQTGQSKVRIWLQRFGFLLGCVFIAVVGVAAYQHLNTSH